MTQIYNPNTYLGSSRRIRDSRLSLAEIVTVSLGYMRLSEKKMLEWILLHVIYSFTSLLGLAGLDNVRFTIQH